MKAKYLMIGLAAILCSCSSSSLLNSSSNTQHEENESIQEDSLSLSDSQNQAPSIKNGYRLTNSSAFLKLKLKSIIDEPLSYTSCKDDIYTNYVVGVFQVEHNFYRPYKNLDDDIYIPFSTEYTSSKEKKYLVDTVKELLLSYDTFYVYINEIGVPQYCDVILDIQELFEHLPEGAVYSVVPGDIRFSGQYVFPIKDNKLKIDEVNDIIKEQGCETDCVIDGYSYYFFDDMEEEILENTIKDLFIELENDQIR